MLIFSGIIIENIALQDFDDYFGEYRQIVFRDVFTAAYKNGSLLEEPVEKVFSERKRYSA